MEIKRLLYSILHRNTSSPFSDSQLHLTKMEIKERTKLLQTASFEMGGSFYPFCYIVGFYKPVLYAIHELQINVVIWKSLAVDLS